MKDRVYYIILVSLLGYSFFSLSIIAAIILVLYILLVFLLEFFGETYSKKQGHVLFLSIIFSSLVIIFFKGLYIYDISFMDYRLSNTFEHINLMFGLSIITYFYTIKYVKEIRDSVLITIMGAFSLSVILEVGQYFYREYYNLVTGVSHGLYYDSMIDISVNFISAVAFGFLFVFIIGKYIKNNLGKL